MLGISERGVAAQVSRLLVKFGVANRASLVAAVLSELTADEEPPRPLDLALAIREEPVTSRPTPLAAPATS